MELELIAGGPAGTVSDHSNCYGGHCPTVYRTGTGTLVVQGYTVTDPTNADLGPGESLVEIPAALIKDVLARI